MSMSSSGDGSSRTATPWRRQRRQREHGGRSTLSIGVMLLIALQHVGATAVLANDDATASLGNASLTRFVNGNNHDVSTSSLLLNARRSLKGKKKPYHQHTTNAFVDSKSSKTKQMKIPSAKPTPTTETQVTFLFGNKRKSKSNSKSSKSSSKSSYKKSKGSKESKLSKKDSKSAKTQPPTAYPTKNPTKLPTRHPITNPTKLPTQHPTTTQLPITVNVIVRLETLLTDIPGGDATITTCKIDNFVENCVAKNVEGVSVELKRSDVNTNVASPQLGHLYFDSDHSNTAVYTGKGYKESFLFDLLAKLRAEGIKTYAWWPTFNDAVLAQSNPTNALHTRFDFGSSDPTDLTVSTQFVSSHSDVVRQHQLDMLDEILTHPSMSGWDGVRLDYIRFNYDEDDFSQPARDEYTELYGVDPLTSVTSTFDQPWKNFRRDTITSFLQEATARCHSLGPNLDIGGYFLPFPAHPGGFDTFQGQGNDFTKYHTFGFRVLPMVYYQDWSTSSNFEAWTKEKVFYSVDYSTDSPAVWPTLSITTTDWCGDDESCHRQHIVDALLIAANSGEEAVNYGSRTVEMFNYAEWGKIEWDRLSFSQSSANEIILSGKSRPTPSRDPTDCTYFVPCGYEFYPGKDSPGIALYTSEWRNIRQITLDCDADPGCKGFNSNGITKSDLLGQQEWVKWTSDPCLGLYVKGSHSLKSGIRKRKRGNQREPI